MNILRKTFLRLAAILFGSCLPSTYLKNTPDIGSEVIADLKTRTISGLKRKGYEAAFNGPYLEFENSTACAKILLSYLEHRFKEVNLNFDAYFDELVIAVDKILAPNNHRMALNRVFPRLVPNYTHKENKADSIVCKYNETFNLVFVEDVGPLIIPVAMPSLALSGINTLEELKEIAQKNIDRFANDIKVEEIYQGLWEVGHGLELERLMTSLLLLPNLIESVGIATKGQPIIFAAEANWLLLADTERLGALLDAAVHSIDMVPGDGNLVFARPLCFVNGKWEVYDVKTAYPEIEKGYCKEDDPIVCTFFRTLNYIDQNKRYADFIAQKQSKQEVFAASLFYISFDADEQHRIYYNIWQDIPGESFISKADVVWVVPASDDPSSPKKGKILSFSTVLNRFGKMLVEVAPQIYQVKSTPSLADLEAIEEVPFCTEINVEDIHSAFMQELCDQ